MGTKRSNDLSHGTRARLCPLFFLSMPFVSVRRLSVVVFISGFLIEINIHTNSSQQNVCTTRGTHTTQEAHIGHYPTPSSRRSRVTTDLLSISSRNPKDSETFPQQETTQCWVSVVWCVCFDVFSMFLKLHLQFLLRFSAPSSASRKMQRTKMHSGSTARDPMHEDVLGNISSPKWTISLNKDTTTHWLRLRRGRRRR